MRQDAKIDRNANELNLKKMETDITRGTAPGSTAFETSVGTPYNYRRSTNMQSPEGFSSNFDQSPTKFNQTGGNLALKQLLVDKKRASIGTRGVEDQAKRSSSVQRNGNSMAKTQPGFYKPPTTASPNGLGSSLRAH